MAVWDDTQGKVMQQLADKFHETHPDITVKVQITPWDQYWTKLKTAATGGAAPDVFWMNESNFATYANGGVLANLSDKLDGSEIDMSNYIDIQTKAYTFDGERLRHPEGHRRDRPLVQQGALRRRRHPRADGRLDLGRHGRARRRS